MNNHYGKVSINLVNSSMLPMLVDYEAEAAAGNIVPVTAVIQKIQRLTPDEYDDFVNSLTEERDWLTGFGGSCYSEFGEEHYCIKVVAENRKTLYVNPLGNGCVHCVGFEKA